MKQRQASLKQKAIFTTLFVILGLLALQLPLTQLVGSKAKFTLLDILAPTVGVFIGIGPGVLAVLIVQAVNTFMVGGFGDVGGLIRLFPTLFAVWYFAKKDKTTLVVPLLAIFVFNLHPIGRTVWYYSLFWTIPLITHFFRQRLLIARSLGATFTAHSVGGALWIWAFNLPASVWQNLIPVVIVERAIFAAGISITYLVLTNGLQFLIDKKVVSLPFRLEKRYLLIKQK